MKTCAILVLLAGVAMVAAGDKKRHMLTCGSEQANMDKAKENEAMQNCKKIFAEGGDKMAMGKKFMVCSFIAQEIYKDSQMNAAKYKEAMTSLFPTKGGELADQVASTCFVDANTKGLNADQPDTFNNLLKCMHDEYKKVCGTTGSSENA